MLRLLFKISSRLVSATLLVGVTIGFIYLATTRSLPFLPEDEQVYSTLTIPQKRFLRRAAKRRFRLCTTGKIRLRIHLIYPPTLKLSIRFPGKP